MSPLTWDPSHSPSRLIWVNEKKIAVTTSAVSLRDRCTLVCHVEFCGRQQLQTVVGGLVDPRPEHPPLSHIIMETRQQASESSSHDDASGMDTDAAAAAWHEPMDDKPTDEPRFSTSTPRVGQRVEVCTAYASSPRSASHLSHAIARTPLDRSSGTRPASGSQEGFKNSHTSCRSSRAASTSFRTRSAVLTCPRARPSSWHTTTAVYSGTGTQRTALRRPSALCAACDARARCTH